MADVHDKATRSYNMSRVGQRDTKPEMIVRKYLFSKGFRYRLQDKKLPGTPDIVLKKYKTVIFVNGCFWHSHDCGNYSYPKTNVDFWKKKFGRNYLRDIRNQYELEQLGWNVLVFWECELKSKNRLETLEKVVRELERNQQFLV